VEFTFILRDVSLSHLVISILESIKIHVSYKLEFTCYIY
jgi:hypothetical protein